MIEYLDEKSNWQAVKVTAFRGPSYPV